MARLNQAEQARALDGYAALRREEAAARRDVWTPGLVQAALEEAGKAVLALPASHVFPASGAGYWPEIVRVIREGDRAVDTVVRAAIPSARAIAAMDVRLDWPTRYVVSTPARRIVAARMLVSPVSERHLWSWRALGVALRVHRDTVQRWHAKALGEIARGLARDGAPVQVGLISKG